MSEKKKDLKAFLAKQTKKGKKTTAAAEPEKTVEEEKTPQAEVKDNKEQIKKKAEKQESSDEELDEEQQIDGMSLGFAKIKEQKDVKGKVEIAESEKMGFGLENDNAKNAKKSTAKQSDEPIKRNTGGDITFGGKPMKFGRRKVAGTKFADDFNDDLGDIGDDGKVQKKNKNTEVRNENASGATVGGREWINLGAGAREHRDQDEERKTENRTPAVKPTFKGRMNLKGTGSVANEDDGGVRPSYDFKVSYKTNFDDQEKGGENREKKQYNKDKGVSLNDFNKKAEENDDEEGFQIIRGRERKQKTANDGESSEDENGFEVKRGGERGRGGGGRGGGFFKNSSKRKD